MTSDNLIFKGLDTGVSKSVKPIDVIIVVNIDMFGKEYYIKLLEHGLYINKELKKFFDEYFKIEKTNE